MKNASLKYLALYLLSLAPLAKVQAQGTASPLFQLTAPIRATTAAGAAVVMNQLASQKLPEDNTRQLVQKMAEQIQALPSLTPARRQQLAQHLGKLEARYHTSIQLEETDFAKAYFRPGMDFDQLLSAVSQAVRAHAEGRESSRYYVQETARPCASAPAGTRSMHPPHFIDPSASVPIQTEVSGQTLDANGQVFQLRTLHGFPGSASPEVYRQHVGWTGPLGNAESRIVEIAYSQGSAPEAVLQAFINDKNSLGLSFSGYVLVYDTAYRFKRGYSYTEGRLQESQQLKLKREPLAMAQGYPIGAHTCQQQLIVTSGPEAADTYPLPDLCYQAVWNIQFAVKGSYLDINSYLD